MVLSPELAEPLDRQGVRCDHQAAFDLAGVDESIQDERRLDGLTEAHLVGEQPPYGVARACSLGDVQLMWEETDSSAEKRSQTIGFAQRQQVQDVHPREEVLVVVEFAKRQSLEQRTFEFERPQRVRRQREAIRQFQRAIGEAAGDLGLFLGRGDSHWPPRAEIDRDQRVTDRGDSERCSGSREFDQEPPVLDRRHAPDTEFGIETMREAVADVPPALTRRSRATICCCSGGRRRFDAAVHAPSGTPLASAPRCRARSARRPASTTETRPIQPSANRWSVTSRNTATVRMELASVVTREMPARAKSNRICSSRTSSRSPEADVSTPVSGVN
jgi:hypothetical protein